MKTPSDELFNLIKSLDTQEKVYFKMFSQRKTTGSNNYILLFDAINGMNEYDEEKLKLCLKGNQILLRNLKSVKKYTTEAILKSLTEYYLSNTVESNLRNLLHQVEILSGKKLFSLAYKTLEKLEKIASDYELFEYLLLASKQRADLAYNFEKTKKTDEYLTKNLKTEHAYLEMIKNNCDFRELMFKVHFIKQSKGFNEAAKVEIARLISSMSILSSPEKALTFYSKYCYYRIHGTMLISQGKVDAVGVGQQVEWISYLEKNPSKLNQRAELYLTSLSFLLVTLSYYKDTKDADVCLNKAIKFYLSLPNKVKSETIYAALAKVIHNYLHNQITWVNPKKALEKLQEIEKNIPMSSNFKLQDDSKLARNINLFQCYFLIEDYKKAILYLNNIVNVEIDLFTQNEVKFYLLMVHYELKNLDIIDYLCETTERWLSKNSLLGVVERKILLFFRKTIHAFNSKSERSVILNKYKNELIKISSNRKGLILDLFLPWIESKVENRPLIEVLKEKIPV